MLFWLILGTLTHPKDNFCFHESIFQWQIELFFSPKWVLPPQKKNTSHIFKIDIFSKFFGDVMSHIIRWNAGKKTNPIFELFNEQKLNLNMYCFQLERLYYFIEVYGTSELSKFDRNDFKHNLYCCIWCWLQMSA